MVDLIHLVYCSTATQPVGRKGLGALLEQARRHNAACGITGMLLHHHGAFFQVLEGPPAEVDRLYQQIARDPRHTRLVRIIREPIASRAFGDWTMGYAEMAPGDVGQLEGLNDFFRQGAATDKPGASRALRLLEAFRQGRWRATLSDQAPSMPRPRDVHPPAAPDYSFAYQPIVQTTPPAIFAYEALIRGARGESAAKVLDRIDPFQRPVFNEESRIRALEMAARLGLSARLHINFPPSDIRLSATAVSSVLTAAGQGPVSPRRITLEILESDIVENPAELAAMINDYRSTGLAFAIDDFGAGYAGLNLLADFQPDYVKLDRLLARDIERQGPRQAIVRGIVSTCRDLGITLIAEGIERAEEFFWFRDEGLRYFQGYLLARPAFESLPATFSIPD